MKNVIPLMQREWLQHRFAWALMLLLPLALALLPLTFGDVRVDEEELGAALPTALALASLGGGIGVTFIVVFASSLILMSGLARRDHGDRSNEFWMSLPIGHAASLVVPLLVHLLLLPAVALLVGLVAGVIVSIPVVTAGADFASWTALPWAALLTAAISIVARMLAGLPLALLWLSPLILTLVLLGAWVGRWGIVILAVGVGLGSAVLDKLLGQPWPALVLGDWLSGAALSLAGASQGGMVNQGPYAADIALALPLVPGWAMTDLMHALRLLASPALVGGLLLSTLCFWLLLRWRRAGA